MKDVRSRTKQSIGDNWLQDVLVFQFHMQLTKAYMAETSCKSVVIDWLCFAFTHQDLFADFSVLFQKYIYDCLACVLDNHANSWHPNSEEMRNGNSTLVPNLHNVIAALFSTSIAASTLKCPLSQSNRWVHDALEKWKFLLYFKLLQHVVIISKAWLLFLTHTDHSCSMVQ